MDQEAASRGDKTRGDIIDAAHHLFISNGYHGTSMRQIASQAGIALGTIYNHFSSKEDIFFYVLVAWHPFYDVMPALQAAEGETVEAFVRDAADRMVANTQDRLDYLNLMFIELVEFKSVHLPHLFQMFMPSVLGLTQRFIENKKELRPIPVMVLVRAFIGLFFSYIMTEVILAKNLPSEMQENAFEHFVEIYLHGILVRDPDQEA
ncbi:MAG: TetR/AcrR family transcriptional regulator [Anaerolineales bacterium]